jgi:DTW domain-containing protein
MVQRLECLQRLPRLALAAPTVAPRRLRQAARPGEMATLEAIAHAIGLLEGDAVAAPLHALFKRFVDQVMSMRERPQT